MRSSANHRQPGKGCQFDCQIEWVELLKTQPVLGTTSSNCPTDFTKFVT